MWDFAAFCFIDQSALWSPLNRTLCDTQTAGRLQRLLIVLIPPIPQQQTRQNYTYQLQSCQTSIGQPPDRSSISCPLSSEIPSSEQQSCIHSTLLLGYLYSRILSAHHDHPRREDVLAPSPALCTSRSSQSSSVPVLKLSNPGFSHDRPTTHPTQDRIRDVHAARFYREAEANPLLAEHQPSVCEPRYLRW